MAQPTAYVPTYDFTDFQTAHPSDPLPADELDIQLNLIKIFTQQVCTNLAMIQRDDGALANASVGIDQLSPEIDFGFATLTNWVTAHAYVVRDGVYQGNNVYRCIVAHTSDTFATDLAAGKWVLVANFNQFLSAAAASAAAALVSQNAAAASAAAALVSQNAAAASVAALSATSVTSQAVATGAKTFVTQSGKLFVAGQFLQIASSANPANYMHGTVTSYAGTSLVMNITDIGGSGTLASWNISISGTQGPTGATGPSGPGSGDMLAANNLNDVANLNTSRTNLSAAKSANNSDITSLSGLTTPLSLTQGGTGAANAAGATAALNIFAGDSGAGGTKGLVPAPAAGDAAALRVLGAGGGWVNVATGISSITTSGGVTGGTITTTGNISLDTNNSVGVGCYALLKNVSGGTISDGATNAGSGLSLVQFNAAGSISTVATPPGTWRAIGGNFVANNFTSLFIRTA